MYGKSTATDEIGHVPGHSKPRSCKGHRALQIISKMSTKLLYIKNIHSQNVKFNTLKLSQQIITEISRPHVARCPAPFSILLLSGPCLEIHPGYGESGGYTNIP